jgi:class 3 adenylate cyclase/tetratricopeptide (TPR) repeat protein
MPQLGNLLTKSDLTDALRNYLPSSLERQCLHGDEIREPGLCARHLAALLRTISTYLPRQVVVPLLAAPRTGRVEGGFVHGTVMFSDISGFTAMSEKLSQLGKEGAEEVTAIVNRFFAALLQVTDRYGGDLLKFGGDALLVFFGGEGHELSACLAALQMQATMSAFSETSTSQGVFRLRMTVGLGTGPLFMAHLGSEEGMEFAVMGRAMTQMAKAEDKAAAGEIFIDAETCQAVANQVITDDAQDGFYRLVGCREGRNDLDVIPGESPIVPPPPSEEELLPWIAQTVQRIQALELFLPPGLMDKIILEPERTAIGGEYRPVTVLFANFYGIDEIIQELGETRSAEITAILNAHFTTMKGVIAKYGGVVNKVDSYAVGHRLMVLFGAPRAHIDDPERAVRAALEMQAAMAAFAELNTSRGTFDLKQRIGVNTGLVFAGNVGSLIRQEYSVMGDEVNLTARLMAAATEGQVLISQNTARQSGDAFLLHEQEPVRVKGKALPVHNCEVLSVCEHRVRERRPLIGRDDEWRTIRAVIEQSWAGEARILTIVGDVGLGKSRLLDEVIACWTEHGVSHYTTCPSFGRHTPYLPWLDLLRAMFGFNPADSSQVRLEKVGAVLQEVDPAWRDWVTLIGRLLGLEVEETDLVRALDAQTRQRAIFRIVMSLVSHIASERPLLLAIDDLQWADDASIELVNQVARQVSGQPLLLALAYRSEEPVALNAADLPHHTGVQLRELEDESSLRLLNLFLPITPEMPGPLKRLILDKARGNPLFIEEVAHSLIENYLTLDEATGAYHARADLEQIEVPDSINRVIMSRIDRLDESSRNVLRVASVIGRQFEQWLLSAIYPYRHVGDELLERLDELSQRELLEGPHADLLYLFQHILTREVAYESLLYADRRSLHRRIGECIESQRAGRLAEYYEVLAYHFGLAEEWNKALHYDLRAGRKAQDVYANQVAIHHFRQALKAAERLPGCEDCQLAAHEGLGQVLTTVGCYDEALEHNYQALALVMVTTSSAEEMARRLADLCCKTASIHEKKSSYNTAFNWLRGGLLALEGMDAIETARIHLLGAGIHHRQGKNSEAVEWCRRSLDIAEKVSDREGQSAIAHAYYLLGLIHERLGDTDRTIEFCQESLDIYEQIGDIGGASQAHINLGSGYLYQGNWPEAIKHYLVALEIKRKIGDIYYQAVITLNLGQAYLDQGDLDQATDYNRQSLEMWQTLGSTYAIALLRNNMGAVALQRGDPDEARVLFGKSLELFQQINSRDFMPEVYRHLAEAYLGRGDLDQALDSAQHSLTWAREQSRRLEEGGTRRVLGQVLLARPELVQAEQELEESLRILQELNSLYEIGKTLFQIARLHQARGDEAQMQMRLGQAQSIFEGLGARLDLARCRELMQTLNSTA